MATGSLNWSEIIRNLMSASVLHPWPCGPFSLVCGLLLLLLLTSSPLLTAGRQHNCSHPLVPEHGRFCCDPSPCRGFPPETYIWVFCEPGFHLSSNMKNISMCDHDGKWRPPIPACIRDSPNMKSDKGTNHVTVVGVVMLWLATHVCLLVMAHLFRRPSPRVAGESPTPPDESEDPGSPLEITIGQASPAEEVIVGALLQPRVPIVDHLLARVLKRVGWPTVKAALGSAVAQRGPIAGAAGVQLGSTSGATMARHLSDQLDPMVDGLPVSLPSYEEAVYSSEGQRIPACSAPGPTQLLLAQELPFQNGQVDSSHRPLLSSQSPENPPPPYEEVQSPHPRDRTSDRGVSDDKDT
ncbi:uncharacterized protein KZ484_023083 [Pholidichthys leucotaenia]